MKTSRISRLWTTAVAAVLFAVALAYADKFDDRVSYSADVFKALINTPDQGVPKYMLDNCRGLIIIPGMKKGAFIVGGEFGRGVVIYRKDNRKWSPPAFVSISEGSFGLQIGGQSTDLVLFIMSESGVKALRRNKFTLGADASVTAGPMGSTAPAGVDVTLTSDIYAYYRSSGLFAGIAINGSNISQDDKADKDYYGKKLSNRDILFKNTVTRLPKSAEELVRVLP
jgi:lipid-binding SYLF domain-containing protein